MRLIVPDQEARLEYFKDIPERFRHEDGQLLFVPLHHIFGSEELSALAPGNPRQCPEPYVAMHPEDAAMLGMAEGGRAKVFLDGTAHDLSLKMLPSLPRGTARHSAWAAGGPIDDLHRIGEDFERRKR